jgi:hypothetical protein
MGSAAVVLLPVLALFIVAAVNRLARLKGRKHGS